MFAHPGVGTFTSQSRHKRQAVHDVRRDALQLLTAVSTARARAISRRYPRERNWIAGNKGVYRRVQNRVHRVLHVCLPCIPHSRSVRCNYARSREESAAILDATFLRSAKLTVYVEVNPVKTKQRTVSTSRNRDVRARISLLPRLPRVSRSFP